MDTYTTPATWELAHRAAGGAAALASAIWEGKAKRGFALTRPPGHHAMHGQGMGFCLLNNIAHCCRIFDSRIIMYSGWQSLTWICIMGMEPRIYFGPEMMCFIFQHTSHLFILEQVNMEDIGEGDGEGWTANFPLPAGSGDSAFITIMDELIIPLLDQEKPQMILVSYGFDAHWLDPLGTAHVDRRWLWEFDQEIMLLGRYTL